MELDGFIHYSFILNLYYFIETQFEAEGKYLDDLVQHEQHFYNL